MSAPVLPTSAGLVRRLVLLNTVMSLPALAIIVATLFALIRLTYEQWAWLYGFAGIYVVVGTPINVYFQRRIVASLCEWLTAVHEGRASEPQARAALREIIALPTNGGIVTSLSWVVPIGVISIAMELTFPGWGSYEHSVMLVSAVAAGFTTGSLLGFRVKTLFADVREALVDALPDPEVRASCIRHLPIRTRITSVVTGVALVPVIFAVLLSSNGISVSLQGFAVRTHDELLRSLPERPDATALHLARARADGSALPFDIEFGVLETLEPELEASLVAHVRSEVKSGATGGDSLGFRGDQILSWRRLDDGRVIAAVTPAAQLGGSSKRNTVIFGLLFAVSVGLAFVAARLLSDDVSRAVSVLRGEAERMASGDLSRGRVFESEDELGELARSFELMGSSLRATVSRVAEAADRVEATAGELSPVSRGVAEVSADQVSGIEQATSSMEEINAQVRGIAGGAAALNESTEEASSSILELGASSEELNDTASLLSSKVEEVSSSIEQMVRSVTQVSENTEGLAGAAEETSASMEEMASSLREVDASAAEAARLSAQVVSSAESGQAKVRQTIEGMDAIREVTETAEVVIRSLHGRTVEIGAIVDVIDDVADETNLLALNAAIIAAQAGDHGRAFSVVADEIKDLAERVLASTKEIGSLIGSVQEEARRATSAIERGSESVASGVDLSAEAGMALEEITQASRESGSRITGIVTSMREQAKAAVHVVELMETVRRGVDEIRSASAEQDRGNVVVYEGSVTMREVAQQVRGTTEEQSRGSGRIRESVEGVREAVEQIDAALQEQSQACAAAAEFLEAVRARTRSNDEATRTLDAVTRELLVQAEALRDEVRRFQL